MGDLISRSALLRKKTRMTEYDETGCGVNVIVVRAEDIENAPAVDAEPVRHAYWEVTQKDCIQCSECHEEWAIRDIGEFIEFEAQEDLEWCPSCGARMDAEENT